MPKKITGECLCGLVRYAVTGPFNEFHICHCSQCRRSTGTAHASNLFSTADRLEWLSGEDQVKRFDPHKPGVIAKCFCSNCGSLVPYISAKSGKLVVPAGGLNEDPEILPQDNIFWPNRAVWYDAIAAAPRCKTFMGADD